MQKIVIKALEDGKIVKEKVAEGNLVLGVIIGEEDGNVFISGGCSDSDAATAIKMLFDSLEEVMPDAYKAAVAFREIDKIAKFYGVDEEDDNETMLN